MISSQELIRLVGAEKCPLIVDVRRDTVFAEAPTRIAASLWRDHTKVDQWLPLLPGGRRIVVYCAHGHNVSEIALAKLRAAGADAQMLEGGIDAWEEAGGPVLARTAPGLDPATQRSSEWVTRTRPKVDRIACPWLIRRFIDPLAVVHFVAAEWVRDVADEIGAIPFDIVGVDYSHRADECTFDTLLSEFRLTDPALLHLARIVRGADTARLDLEPQAAGLLALSLGLSAVEDDDHAQLEKGMIVYDGLYGWCRHARDETHNWPARAA
ncbi:chromate resistance protein ChrB domain-containing protein [Mesorhizobium marinum]|uniref:chromate resistance protein ChrB domain-containing protein n=1 Tax=Mesorhizobium marinum TaxID=3228790 RepID=UPI003F5C8B3D